MTDQVHVRSAMVSAKLSQGVDIDLLDYDPYIEVSRKPHFAMVPLSGGASAKVNPSGKATIFLTEVSQAKEAAKELEKVLDPYTAGVSVADIKIDNIVAVGNLGRNIDLYRLATVLGVVYTPEIHPALSYRSGGVNFSIFHTGSVNMTGCGDKDVVQAEFDKLVEVIEREF